MGHKTHSQGQRPDRSNASHGRAGDRSGSAVARQYDFPLHFLSAFVRDPFTVGSVWPSSQRLARMIVDSCDIRPKATVVEIGPGTGAFTGRILERVAGRGRFLAVEVNETYANILHQRFPLCEVVHDSAENLPRLLGGRKADCIISGLAWGNMGTQLQNVLLRSVLDSLAPGGQFATFAYAHTGWFPTARRFRRCLEGCFDLVETTPIVWRNVPPAYVYRCSRAKTAPHLPTA